jgi:hypothetical protein
MPARGKQAVDVLTVRAPNTAGHVKYSGGGLYFSKIVVTNQPALIVPVT